MYTTIVPRPDSNEDESEIGSDGEDEHRKLNNTPNDKEEYIYKLRVELADSNRRIFTEAHFKEVSTHTWANLTAKASKYKVWNDDADWKIRMQAFC